ncbi:actin depolymerizing protein [Piromyces finnis]|uniref:Actin depolymerizing protein n=1 Tax=Piromyces finnis TaxID=1754191 RepID=A0A1Y1UUI2_9FUNG|nr:actin depolymerizing protein [Piromyces finnis]|eukprot:ORX41675.1 actin depolymerizing protein [Piromyces finnis]
MWDAADVFPVGIGETEGIDIFRIEELSVAMIDPDEYGSFSTGDCYIILNTYREEKELKHKIFQWIGKQAENDKLFCSAIYSVMLKGLINETENIFREVEGEESDDLKDLFSTDIKYLDYNESAESRLSSPYEIQYPLRMYKIFDNGKFHLVETSHLMFNTNNVFIIDNGFELYQWNGKKSSIKNRVFGNILLKRINSNERNKKAEVKEFEEFEEDDSFWELFEEERTEENGKCVFLYSNEKYGKFFEVAKQPSKLYKVPDIESLDDIDCENYLVAEKFFFDKNLLNSENCYVMDCGVELFLWTGKKASENCRDLVQEFTVKLIPNKLRPNWVGLHRFNEKSENEIFSIRFFNWGMPENTDLSKLILPGSYIIN